VFGVIPPIHTTFCVKLLSVARLTSNAVSLFELSVQSSFTLVCDSTVAERPLGVVGMDPPDDCVAGAVHVRVGRR
jgi:hypothetical protein